MSKVTLKRSVWVLFCALSVCACSDDDPKAEAAKPEDKDAGGGAEPEQTTSKGCDAPQLAAGLQVVTLAHDGMDRSYQLYVPEGLDPKRPAELLLNYHGLTSNSSQQIAFSAMNVTADREGFLVAYPEGLGMSFNAGSCCSALGNPAHMADDAGFTRAIVDDVGKKGCVDLRRVYSTGMSNGGYMSEYNACKNADVFAAVAPVSAMAFAQTDCTPSRPIAMIAFNGTADQLVNYTGASATVSDWRQRNGCQGEPARTSFGDSYCDSWTECDDGVELTHCTLTGMGHCWPGTAYCPYGSANTELSANDEMWKFLQRFTLPD